MTTAPVAFEADIAGSDDTAPAVAAPPIRFGGNVTFLGYDHDWAPTYAPGDVVPVVTYWRVDGYVPPDLRLFTHILSDPTNPVAQSDPISVLPGAASPARHLHSGDLRPASAHDDRPAATAFRSALTRTVPTSACRSSWAISRTARASFWGKSTYRESNACLRSSF